MNRTSVLSCHVQVKHGIIMSQSMRHAMGVRSTNAYLDDNGRTVYATVMKGGGGGGVVVLHQPRTKVMG